MTTKEELDALRLEREKLELEDLRNKVEAVRRKKAADKLSADQQEQSIKEAQRQEKIRQSICNHRKGGMGLEGMIAGNDTNYAVIKHQLPNGDWLVMCTRCCKMWKKEDAGFNAAIGFPTDNQPSGATLFANTYKS